MNSGNNLESQNTLNQGRTPSPVGVRMPPVKLTSSQLQRRNLFQMTHISIKVLIETGIKQRHQLDESHEPLNQFCVMLEHSMRHGLTPRKREIFKFNKQPTFLEFLRQGLKNHRTGTSCLETINSMPGLKTDIAKCRAWIRLALMEKRLAEYFQYLLDQRSLLEEFYQPFALMRNEEINVIAGLLLSLSSIDANLDLKGGDLEEAGVIDFSQYLSNGNMSAISNEEINSGYDSNTEEDGGSSASQPNPLSATTSGGSGKENLDDAKNIQNIIAQKIYAEDLAAYLQTKYQGVDETLNSLKEEKVKISKENDELKVTVESLEQTNKELNEQIVNMSESHSQKLKDNEENLIQSQQSFQESLSTMESMYQTMKKQFESEMAMRLEAETILASISDPSSESKSEVSTGESNGKLQIRIDELEKELEEKEQSITSLTDNASKLTSKIQTLEEEVRSKTESLTHLTNEAQNAQKYQKEKAPSSPSAEKWTLSDQENNCLDCKEEFSIQKRKTKCRSCGKAYCFDCTTQTTIKGGSRQIRLCKDCYAGGYE